MKRPLLICLALAVTVVPLSLTAAERQPIGAEKNTTPPPAVELFQAIDSKLVEVQFIPLDAARANVVVANKTDRVLHIELPQAIAAIPVLGQLGEQFGGGGGGGGAGQSQGVGGGLLGGGNQGAGNQGQGFGNNPGGGRQGIGMGFMRIPPEKSRKLKATTVCLEHGKAEPNPRINYRMIRIEEFTKDDRVVSLCEQLGRGEIPQNTAQAVAWNLTDGLSWEELAKINRIESRYFGNIKYFQRSELEQAQSIAQAIEKTLVTEANENVYQAE